MIKHMQGSLLKADAEALVNTVNCVGVMGKGIALQFKQAFPDNFRQYERACRAQQVRPGSMFIVRTGDLYSPNPKYIINFPTKVHWRSQSRLEDIQSGLEALVQDVRELQIKSIAIPPLGCGNGGLDWEQVRPLIEGAFANLPNVQVLLFTPQEAPAVDAMPVATGKPKMTRARALLIRLLDRYGAHGFRLSRLEIQKLAYFLQYSGENLRLNFVKHKYGPYAETLNHLLQRIEGHYIRGYGDRSHRSEVYLLSGATDEANDMLNNSSDAEERLSRVSRLIEGFEDPYGMELLASVLWVAQEKPTLALDVEEVVLGMQNWNQRKHKIFKPGDIHKAWQRLYDENWLPVVRIAA